MCEGGQEYSFLWIIENYSYCWHKTGESLNSPEFTADGLMGTAWYLRLYPRGQHNHDNGNISLYLRRSQVDDGPIYFPLKFELSFLARGRSPFLSREYGFLRDSESGQPKFVQMQEVLMRRKVDYLPRDTLSVLCKIRKGEGNLQQAKQITARTRIGIEHISFLHVTERFSTLEPNQKKTVQISSASKNGLALSSSLYYSRSDDSLHSEDPGCEEEIMVEIMPFDTNKILLKCKISVIGKSGKVIVSCEADNRLDVTRVRQDIQKLLLALTRQDILNGKCEYLPDDKLSLQCECIFSTGIEFEKIERCLNGLPTFVLNELSDNGLNKNTHDAAEKLNVCPGIIDDLKSIYNSRLFTDVELKTKTKSFPAHKVVLCARSSVFKATLTNDMKEKNTDCIKVDDLENDTVQLLMLFLYSDNIENLRWESAFKLYYAADKYAIEKLKVECSTFLVHNVTTSTASELLLLADTHNDPDLKKAVEDFIFKHEDEVFGSEEWRNLIETNSLLVSKTMCLKYMRK